MSLGCDLGARGRERKDGRGAVRRGLLRNSRHDMETGPQSLAFRTSIQYIYDSGILKVMPKALPIKLDPSNSLPSVDTRPKYRMNLQQLGTTLRAKASGIGG